MLNISSYITYSSYIIHVLHYLENVSGYLWNVFLSDLGYLPCFYLVLLFWCMIERPWVQNSFIKFHQNSFILVSSSIHKNSENIEPHNTDDRILLDRQGIHLRQSQIMQRNMSFLSKSLFTNILFSIVISKSRIFHVCLDD